MKNTKHVIVMALVLALTAGLLSACGSPAEPNAPVSQPSAGSQGTGRPDAEPAGPSEANSEYAGKSYTGQGMSVTSSAGDALAVVDVTLHIISDTRCEVLYPLMTFEPTFTCSYTLDGNVITIGECESAAPVDALKASWDGVARKTFILNDDGTMTADPAVEEPEAEEPAPSEAPSNPDEDGGNPADALEANSIYFDYSFSMMGNEIADFFSAAPSAWYAALGQTDYVPVDGDNSLLFAFTGGWCKIECYKDGTYALSSSANEYIRDSGTWTWAGYTFTLTRDADGENPITATVKR